MKKETSQAKSKKSTPITFRTIILKGGKDIAGIEVPKEIIQKIVNGESQRLSKN